MKFLTMIKESIGIENPVFVSFLALCPMLATSDSFNKALGMGLSVLIVIVLSNTLISIIKGIIPQPIRVFIYLVIIAGLVTSLEMFMKAFNMELYNDLGIYLPLIAVNCLIIARADRFAIKNSVFDSLKDGLAMGISFALSIIVLAFFRELIATGKIEVFNLLIIDPTFMPSIFLKGAGAFLGLGLLAWIFNSVIAKQKNRGEE